MLVSLSKSNGVGSFRALTAKKKQIKMILFMFILQNAKRINDVSMMVRLICNIIVMKCLIANIFILFIQQTYHTENNTHNNLNFN